MLKSDKKMTMMMMMTMVIMMWPLPMKIYDDLYD